VIAGQSTVVHEVAAQLSGAFRIVVPIGGGGLASGTLLGAPGGTRVLGVEVAASRAVSAAIAAGEVVHVDVGPTLADGLAGNLASDALTPGIIARGGADLVAVDEPAISRAVRTLALAHGVVAEPSGAVGVAAALCSDVPEDLPAVFVITGRNVTAGTFTALLEG
jgi:threonine dehydratase